MFMFQFEFVVHWRPLVVILRNNRRFLGIDLIQSRAIDLDRLVVFLMALL